MLIIVRDYGSQKLIGYYQNHMSPQNSLSKKLNETMLTNAIFTLRLIHIFPRIINKCLISIQLYLTNISCIQSYKLKLLLDSCCFYKYPRNIEGTLHGS
jgi:hypothetical protein